MGLFECRHNCRSLWFFFALCKIEFILSSVSFVATTDGLYVDIMIKREASCIIVLFYSLSVCCMGSGSGCKNFRTGKNIDSFMHIAQQTQFYEHAIKCLMILISIKLMQAICTTSSRIIPCKFLVNEKWEKNPITVEPITDSIGRFSFFILKMSYNENEILFFVCSQLFCALVLSLNSISFNI